MTHHTDAERALFEAVASDDGKWPKAIERDAKGNYLLLTTANGWMWWQAARRAPVVPQVWIPTPENINALPEPVRNYICDLETNCDPSETVRHNTILKDQIAGLQVMYRRAADALAAAPQPPEAAPDCLTCNDHGAVGNILNAEPCPDCTIKRGTGCSVSNGETNAAPVQLPEPQAEIEVRSMKTYLDLSIHEWRDTLPDGTYKIYTEQQVRDLLEAHSIKEQST